MTSPGGANPPGGFQYSDDSVIAKIAVEVSATDLDNLGQLTKKTEQLRVGLEAVARSQGDFVKYLQQLPEIQERAANAQKSYLDVLSKSVEMQERLRIAAGSSGPASGPAGGGVGQPDPFSGSVSGMGGVPAGAPAGLQAAAAALGNLRTADPRAYQAWSQAHSMPADAQGMAQLYPSSPAEREEHKKRTTAPAMAGDFREMTADMADAAQMVLNEAGPGGSLIRLAGKGLTSAGKRLQGVGASEATGQAAAGQMGGGAGRGAASEFGAGILDGLGAGSLSGMAKGFGTAGAVVTGALALNRVVQNAGEEYQQYKNLGMIRGGGAAEGYGYEMQARIMSLNPFITTEQSMQIIQSSLRDGYSGKEFDTVTAFMASNLKDMNMSVSESVLALRKNVETGNQSLAGFRAQMEAIKESSKTGVRTFDDMKAAVAANSAGFVDMGMSGGAAGQMAAAGALAFKDSRVLADVGDRFNAAIQQAPGYLAEVGGLAGLSDVMPGEVPYADPNFAQNSWLPLMQIAQDLRGDPHRVELFRIQANLKLPGLNLTVPEAKQLLEYLLQKNPGEVGLAENAKAAGAIGDRGLLRGPNQKARNSRSEMGRAVYQPILDLLNPFNKDESGATKGLGEEIRAIGDIPGNVWDSNMDATYFDGRYQSPVMDQVIEQYGYNGVELVDKDGKIVELNSNNEETMKRLGSGDLNWRQKGTSGPGTPLSETAGALRSDNAQGVQVSGQLMIGLTPEASKLITAPRGGVPLTQNQLQAGAGYGPATYNAPPVGDR